MNRPITICDDSFQSAWANAIRELSNNGWTAWNLIAHVNFPELINKEIDSTLNHFAVEHNLIPPKHVAHTIFPQTFWKNGTSKERFYEKYLRFYQWSRSKAHHGWGTYFERMIRYVAPSGEITDQLGNIIHRIKTGQKNYGASYAMVIPYPHKDLNKLMGAPCLNYITVQVENAPEQTNKKRISLMAVYRNHDFTERTYGNYLGLCNLLKYIAYESNSFIGSLTCISSHAYVPCKKSELLCIANTILGVNA